jgi:hypothetical protein
LITTLLLALAFLPLSPDTQSKPAPRAPSTKVVVPGKPGGSKIKNPVPVSQLKAITARAKLLVEYENAAGPASDAVLALKPDDNEVTNYFLRKTGDTWTAVFGRLNDQQDKFLIAYEADKANDDAKFIAHKVSPPKEDDGFYLAAARAVAAASMILVPADTRYNTYVLPAPADQVYVYFMPAQVRRTVYPWGADARFLYSRDGMKLVQKWQVHPKLMQDEYDAKAAHTGVAAHSHAQGDLPEDSDVYHVLIRKPSRDEYVRTTKGVFVIAADGSIRQMR